MQHAHSVPRNCIVIVSVTHGLGYGAENVLIQLLSGWPASAAPLVVIAPPDSSVYECTCKPNIAFLALNTVNNTITANLKAADQLAPYLQECALVHGWSSRTFEMAWWLHKRLNKPAICTLHDHPKAQFITPSRQLVMRWAANRLDSLVCVSDAVRSACIAAGYRRPLRVIHNGLIDEDQQVRQPSENGLVRIGFLGMNAARKGYHTIENWIRQTEDQPIEWRLYGDAHESYQAEAARLSAVYPGRVFLHGRKPSSTIYPQIDLLISPSIEFDPFPTVLLEAAKASLPVVTTDLGGSKEIVVHQETGFLFSPHQPELGLGWIKLLAQSPDLRSSIGSAARARFVAKFGVERMVTQYADIWAMQQTASHPGSL